MHVLMFIIGGLAIFIALIAGAAGANDQRGLGAIYIYLAISIGLGGVLFLGFGSALLLLQQLVENTKPLHELFENAKARMAPTPEESTPDTHLPGM